MLVSSSRRICVGCQALHPSLAGKHVTEGTQIRADLWVVAEGPPQRRAHRAPRDAQHACDGAGLTSPSDTHPRPPLSR